MRTSTVPSNRANIELAQAVWHAQRHSRQDGLRCSHRCLLYAVACTFGSVSSVLPGDPIIRGHRTQALEQLVMQTPHQQLNALGEAMAPPQAPPSCSREGTRASKFTVLSRTALVRLGHGLDLKVVQHELLGDFLMYEAAAVGVRHIVPAAVGIHTHTLHTPCAPPLGRTRVSCCS